MKKEFCAKCGKQKVKIEGRLFDSKTGKKQKFLICPDDKCESGCFARGGHQHGYWGNKPCIRCGKIPIDGIC